MLVERRIAGQQVVRADDRGVAADIAGAEIALFDHRDIGQAVILGEVVGGGKAMAATADDHCIIGRLWRRLAPDRFPAPLALQRLGEDREDRIAQGGLPVAVAVVVVGWAAN